MKHICLNLKHASASCLMLIALLICRGASAEEYSKSYSIVHRAAVRVHVDDSSVLVSTSDTDQVEFHVTYEDHSTPNIGGKVHVDSRQNGDAVELIVSIRPGGLIGFSGRMTTEVRMPKNADLQVEADDGSVEVSSINGNVSIRTADGSIKASKLSGMNDLHTGDGSIKVAALAGETKLHTSDGTIDAASIDGKCDVSSSDGSIHLAGRFDSLDVKAGDGSVTARVAAGSRISSAWSIRTADGSVDVAIPADFKSDLDLSTSDGHVTLGLPVTVQGDLTRSQIRGTINGGGPTLTIHSDDGSIRLSGI